jgi:hypothetical protein
VVLINEREEEEVPRKDGMEDARRFPRWLYEACTTPEQRERDRVAKEAAEEERQRRHLHRAMGKLGVSPAEADEGLRKIHKLFETR